jgi:hypothetical protein
MQQDNNKQSRDVLSKPRVLRVGVVLKTSTYRRGHSSWGNVQLYGQVSNHFSADVNTGDRLDVMLVKVSTPSQLLPLPCTNLWILEAPT